MDNKVALERFKIFRREMPGSFFIFKDLVSFLPVSDEFASKLLRAWLDRGLVIEDSRPGIYEIVQNPGGKKLFDLSTHELGPDTKIPPRPMEPAKSEPFDKALADRMANKGVKAIVENLRLESHGLSIPDLKAGLKEDLRGASKINPAFTELSPEELDQLVGDGEVADLGYEIEMPDINVPESGKIKITDIHKNALIETMAEELATSYSGDELLSEGALEAAGRALWEDTKVGWLQWPELQERTKVLFRRRAKVLLSAVMDYTDQRRAMDAKLENNNGH